jgi:hypothetical protein
MIAHLQNVNDPLVQKFNSDSLRPILVNSAYHSPEVSETDEENSSGGTRKVVIKDLKWRSPTVID